MPLCLGTVTGPGTGIPWYWIGRGPSPLRWQTHGTIPSTAHWWHTPLDPVGSSCSSPRTYVGCPRESMCELVATTLAPFPTISKYVRRGSAAILSALSGMLGVGLGTPARTTRKGLASLHSTASSWTTASTHPRPFSVPYIISCRHNATSFPWTLWSQAPFSDHHISVLAVLPSCPDP